MLLVIIYTDLLIAKKYYDSQPVIYYTLFCHCFYWLKQEVWILGIFFLQYFFNSTYRGACSRCLRSSTKATKKMSKVFILFYWISNDSSV